MAYKRIPDLTIENATIFGRNFAGKEGQYNRAGERGFCVRIDDADQAQALLEDGWNVKISRSTRPDEDPRYYLPVKVRFDPVPPEVYMIRGRAKTRMTEDTIATLDNADIECIDLVLNPYQWNVQGKAGVTAYLKVMYATVKENPFANKYDSMDADDVPW